MADGVVSGAEIVRSFPTSGVVVCVGVAAVVSVAVSVPTSAVIVSDASRVVASDAGDATSPKSSSRPAAPEISVFVRWPTVGVSDVAETVVTEGVVVVSWAVVLKYDSCEVVTVLS